MPITPPPQLYCYRENIKHAPFWMEFTYIRTYVHEVCIIQQIIVKHLARVIMTTVFQVDTEVCEQCFSWLSRYARITRRMNRTNFVFFMLYLCDLHNQREQEILNQSGYMYN